jgi:hypothetical protein
MNFIKRIISSVILVTCIFSFPSITPIQAEGLLLYKPPQLGAPSGRIGGGTRGLPNESPLILIAPNHTGLTSKESPTLYWHSSKPNLHTVEFSLVQQNNNHILLEKTIQVSSSGFRNLRLRDYGVVLQPGVKYRWLVTMIANEGSSSEDVIASGCIQHQPLGHRLVSAEDYAQASYWYDAVEILMNDASATAKKQLEALLEQGGVAIPRN